MSEVEEPRQPEGVKKTLRGGVSPDVGKNTRIKKGEIRNPEGKNGQDYITQALKSVFGDVEFTKKTVLGILKGKSAIAKVMLIEKAAERIEGKVTQPLDVNLNLSLADRLTKARERREKHNG